MRVATTLITLPVQIGLRAGALALQLGAGIARRAADLASGNGSSAPEQEPPPAPSRPRARVTISSPDTRTRRKRPRPRTPSPPPSPPPEPDHVSEEAVQVASFAEPGAEDTPGPEVEVAEPWEGYDGMRARDVQRELGGATREVAAAVVLYETVRRGRQTVIAAAERRLAALDAAARP